MEVIDLRGVKRCWGNLAFDYVYSEAVGQSGEILCVWDSNMFQKLNCTVSDYFVMVRGVWVPSGKSLLIILIYAPQELSEKRILWDYLRLAICNWDGDVVTMGDFNEVRDCSERFGSVFNKQEAKFFNDFITNAGLVESHYDYGLTPFKFYHYWFEFDEFDKFVEDSWKEIRVPDTNDYMNFMKNLRVLKDKIKTWIRSYKEHTYGRMSILKSELINLDSVIDKGGGVEKNVHRRLEILRNIQELEKTEAVDLESAVSKEEIKRAVWDCGIDKSLGPDGFTFGFYRRYWNLIEGDVVNAVTWFFHHGRIPNGGNSSFITLIPKIPKCYLVKDFRPISLIGSVYKIVAKILANRLVMVLGDLWCKKKRKQSMIFKVDFEKAYDSVRWDFIDTILKKFRFGDKWCNWIGSCLQSSRGSVLVNGSPTSEFQFFKGLKQGDPLSP
ncbi:RNA-directed DNA polymerase, eukaryota, reverse transcriptase zinc-binding domain protein, partial [Tanacetum coccineum]